MAHRNLSGFRQHADLIRAARAWYAAAGYTRIFADLPGMRPPRTIQVGAKEADRPDLTCRDARNRLIVVEAETCNTVNLEETAVQWRIFRQYADVAGGEFHLVVPAECEEQARAQLTSLGIRADRILAL